MYISRMLKERLFIFLAIIFQIMALFPEGQASLDELNKEKIIVAGNIKAKTKNLEELDSQLKALDAKIAKEKKADQKASLTAEKDKMTMQKDQLELELKMLDQKIVTLEDAIKKEEDTLKSEKQGKASNEERAKAEAKKIEDEREALRKAQMDAKIAAQKEQEERLKKKKEEEKKKLNEDLQKTNEQIKEHQIAVRKLTDEINTVVNDLIKSVDDAELEKLKTTKSELLLKKTETLKELTDLESHKAAIISKLQVKDDGYVTAEGTLNWNKLYDIETFQKTKPGTWNLSVVAKDSMNNLSEEAAINVKIDPKSDIPYLNVINPKPKARVPGNLMVVGTAFDDDAVRNVVVYVDNDRKERECVGTDFWYYDLDTSGMEDGVHKLSFKVFDIKGVESKEYDVSFVLDRKVPLINIETINSGAVVSGKKKIGGTVSDTNGIKSLEYSVDDRYSFVAINSVRSAAQNRTKAAWSFDLNTNLLQSGTSVVWIKAVDNAGSEGFFPLTLIVDREGPVIGFNYPQNKEKLGDRFTLYGYAKDNVDIKNVSIKIKFNGFPEEELPVKIRPGNPFWSFPIDVAAMGDPAKLKSGLMSVVATVTDVADNKVTKELSLMIDTELEKPFVSLKNIHKGDSFANNIPVEGTVKDDDEVKEVVLNLYNDKNEIAASKIVSAKYSLSTDIDVSNLPEGAYTLEAIPRDYYVAGDPVRESVWIDRSAPLFDIAKLNKTWAGSIVSDRLTLDFSLIKFGEMPVVSYVMVDAAKGDLLEKGEIKLKNGMGAGIFDAVPVTIDCTKDKKYQGLKLIRLTAVDKAMKRSEVTIPVIVDTTAPAVSELNFDDKTGLMGDAAVTISDNQILESIVITQNSSVAEAPAEITLQPGDEKEFVMDVKNADGKFITYDYTFKLTDAAGLSSETKYRIKFKDTTKTQIKLTVKSLVNNKSIYFDAAHVFMPERVINPDEIRYAYGFTPFNVDSVSLVFGKDTLLPIQAVNKKSGIFMADISPDARQKFIIGENKVTYYQTDDAGARTEVKNYTYYNDLQIPKSKIIWPPAYVPFNQSVTVYGIADDDSGIASVSVGIDQTDDKGFVAVPLESFNTLPNNKVPKINPLNRSETETIAKYVEDNRIDLYGQGTMYRYALSADNLKDGAHHVIFKITDKAGKAIYRDTVVVLDRKAPGVHIVTPLPAEKLNGVISVRGDASDDSGIGNVIFEMNDKIIIANGTTIWDGLYDLYSRKEYDPKKKDAQELAINVIGIDNAGNRAVFPQKIILDQEKDIPVVYINSPAVEEQRYTTDEIKFEGVALDDDGIDSVQYRIDSGLDEVGESKLGGVSEGGWRTILMKDNEKPNWSVTMSPGYLKPGKHILEVRTYDLGYIESETKTITFQIDKENPLIDITGPQNGSYLKGLKLINGKSSDPNEIADIEVSTNNGWTFVQAEGRENWKYYLDSATLPDGALKFLIKARDRAGSESYSFSVYNIDNTPPELSVLLPKDGMSINNKYRIIGRAKDNIALDKGSIKISQGQRNVLENTDEFGFVPINGTDAWYYDVDVSKWEQGSTYHAVVKMADMAGNVTEKSFDFVADIRSDFPTVELDQPQSGQHLTGDMIEFYGTAADDDGIEGVYLEIDGKERVKAEGTTQWKYYIPSIKLDPGMHRVVVVAKEVDIDGNEGKYSQSISRSFYVDDSGVIINIYSHTDGDSVGHRPWITGDAKYYERDLELKIKQQIQTRKYYELKKKHKDAPEKIPELSKIPVTKLEVMSEMNAYLAKNRIKIVYMSYDNGNTFKTQWGSVENWKNRLQTQYLSDGVHMLQFKAVTVSGKETLKYFKIKIDRQLPQVIIDAPTENERVNEQILVKGSTDDNNQIEEVQVRLKRFDKNLGKLPKFIEGMYLWGQAFGGPLVSGGFGFSFFDNIVRLEGAFGWIPTVENVKDFGIAVDNPVLFSSAMGWENNKYEPRFSGFLGGGKLLARVIDLPFEFFFGEDAENFSISVEIGAGFYWISGFGGASTEVDGSYYKAQRDEEALLNGTSTDIYGYDPDEDARVLAGFMYQIDFFKVERYGILKNFALYFENSFYFIASEVESTLTPQFGFGLRNSLF